MPEAVDSRDKFETLMYRQKLAHKAWRDRCCVEKERPSEEVSQLVWELLMSYGEALEGVRGAKEDIYKAAYELASAALREMRIERIFQVYRDDLVDAMVAYQVKGEPEEYRALLVFANTVSTAFCEAHSDVLRKTMRQQRAEVLSNEMKIAKSIQSHLLPKTIPKIPGFDFAGRLIPAAEVGGDYWSIKHYPDDGVVTMKLADITGHGIAAAMLVAAVKFISGSFYRGSSSPSDVMRQTNRVLTLETPHEILVTMVYGWLRPAERELTIVNAGHSPAFLCRASSCTDFAPTGPVLGAMDPADYGEQTLKLEANDIIFFGSDGITEAGIGRSFGVERLKSIVSSSSNMTADEIAERVVEAVRDYAGQPADDISLLVTRVTDDAPTGD